MRQYLDLVDQLGLRGAQVSATPLKEAYPAFAADAQTWVRHALSLLEGHESRLRFTTIDNAPNGREVHWNSAWAWTIAGAGWVHHLFTGLPVTNSVERATVWLNPVVLFVLILIFSIWATSRAGAIAGVVIITAMSCHDRIFEGFFPSYVDHHGLMTAAVMGLALGAVFMGGGWWQKSTAKGMGVLPESPESARTAAVFSAICGATGMWITAASMIPPIGLVGFAGLATVVIQGRKAQRDGASFDPGVWRLWGRVGAIASTFFYLIEYFPNHLGFRLEANHPLHALAWLGAGELIAQFSERWLGASSERWKPTPNLIWPILAVIASPATIALGGTKVFIVLDPFLANLHRDYIQEFLPIWRTIQGFNGKLVYQILIVENLPLIAAIATLTYRGRESSILLWFATLATLLFNMMAWWQSRWLLNASGVQVCLALVVLGYWMASFGRWSRWLIAVAAIGLLYVPSGILRVINSESDVKGRHVGPGDAGNALARDIALSLRSSQPEGEITLLSSPNASTSIGYYGRFKTLGTLYWENDEGLRAAATIFSAKSEDEAAALIRKNHVTHIAIISAENFIQQYYELLHRGATADEIRKCFGYRLFVDKVVPQWLEMLPYKVPDDLTTLNMTVMSFKVNFAQNIAEALYHVALAQIAGGAIEAGDQTLDLLLQKAPQNYQPWLRKGELLLSRHNWQAATDTLLKGISMAPAPERTSLYVSTGSSLYTQGQQELAVRVYRASLEDQRTPDVACYLSWVLATSKEDRLRDGNEALHLAQEALQADANSPTYLNSLAAAYAELGKFPEAVDAEDRAIQNARLRGKNDAFQASQQRLGALQQHLALRQ